MDEVAGAGNRDHGQRSLLQFCANAKRQSGVNGFRQCGLPNTGEIELETIQAVGFHGIKSVLEARADKSPGEYPKLHQTPPSTSESFTFSPDSADLAMATSARMPATPSSMPAPCCGRPCKIASAKFSICSL